MAGSEKTKAGLRDKLRKEARGPQTARGRASASWRAEPRSAHAQHHAYDNGAPFGGSGG